MPNAKHIVIAANPRSGAKNRSDLIASLQDHLARAGYMSSTHYDLDELAIRVQVLQSTGDLRAVVSAGGDGTATAVAARIDKQIPLSLFPLGTENLLARYLGHSADPTAATRTIHQLETRWLDAGTANGKLFLIMVGVGFDADVVRRVHIHRRGHIQRWTYAVPIFRALATYRFPELRIRISNSDLSCESSSEEKSWSARWLFVANLPCYASGLSLAPHADCSDGMLDVCTFTRGGIGSGLNYLYHLWNRTHVRLNDFRSERALQIQVNANGSGNADEAVHYQIDGDYGGTLPLCIKTLPNRLCVLIPAKG